MILIFHITVAVASLMAAGFIYFKPSQTGIYVTYGLTVSMLVSGIYLIATKPAHITQTCVEGLVFLSVISYALFAARKKLTTI